MKELSLLKRFHQALGWYGESEVCEEIHHGYSDLVGRHLGKFFNEVRSTRPDVEAEIVAKLTELSEESLTRLLLAPETTRLLMWPDPARDASVAAEFLIRSVQAEMAREGSVAQSVVEPLWTALGDILILPGGQVVEGPSIKGVAALDLDSPYALGIDVQGIRFTQPAGRTPLAGREREEALAKLSAAIEGIALVSSETSAFVARFTKALVLLRDDQERVFSSGSCAQYVGRSVLGNPQFSAVDHALVAEGVVHESIHGFLYMHEMQESWVLDDSLYSMQPMVPSPWTGRRLPVRPFLQACFVWYGLFNFWSAAAETGVFGTARALERRQAALCGFLKEPLTQLIKTYAEQVNGDLLDALGDLQEQVAANHEAVF
ncbi:MULTISPECIES: HEXXH motif-containing putative peptide modification protein [unclassified Streptomyces]|uniref:aKG-HExxH-type peptide beta-hydroxylase n=1 Tax=unclassified Streptomyces TaxID=2593676 RepID=UPI00332CE21C